VKAFESLMVMRQLLSSEGCHYSCPTPSRRLGLDYDDSTFKTVWGGRSRKLFPPGIVNRIRLPPSPPILAIFLMSSKEFKMSRFFSARSFPKKRERICILGGYSEELGRTERENGETYCRGQLDLARWDVENDKRNRPSYQGGPLS